MTLGRSYTVGQFWRVELSCRWAEAPPCALANITGSGRVKAHPAKMRHMQMNKPKSMKRKARKVMVLNESNEKMVIDNWMPYSGVKKGKKSETKA